MQKSFKIGKYEFGLHSSLVGHNLRIVDIEWFCYRGVAKKTLMFVNNRLKPESSKYYSYIPMPKFITWLYVDLNKYYIPVALTFILRSKKPINIEVKNEG